MKIDGSPMNLKLTPSPKNLPNSTYAPVIYYRIRQVYWLLVTVLFSLPRAYLQFLQLNRIVTVRQLKLFSGTLVAIYPSERR